MSGGDLYFGFRMFDFGFIYLNVVYNAIMKKNEVDLRFCIFDFEDVNHADITLMIGVDPIYIRVKGEKRNPKNPDSPLWESNLWSISCSLDRYVDFDGQMNALLNIIEQKFEAFKYLCKKYPSEFACAIKIYKDNGESTPWVHLDNRYNKIASELNCEFDVDLYTF